MAAAERGMKLDMDAIQAPRASKVVVTAKSSAKPALVKQPNGRGALYSGGVPGNKGNRTPGSGFRQFFEGLRDDPKVHKALRTAARDADHVNHAHATKLAAAYDPNRPKPDAGPPVQVQVGVIFLPPASDTE